MNQAQKDALASALGISPETQRTLDVGSNHAHSCRCRTCLRWWVEMGPDGDPTDPSAYGPFTRDEVLAEARRMNLSPSLLSAL